MAGTQDRVIGPTTASVESFLAGVADERRRADAQEVTALMAEVNGLYRALYERQLQTETAE